MKIIVNGREYKHDNPTITHEDVCQLAGKPASATVTYSGPRRRDGKRQGELRPGQGVELAELVEGLGRRGAGADAGDDHEMI